MPSQPELNIFALILHAKPTMHDTTLISLTNLKMHAIERILQTEPKNTFSL